MADLPEPSDPDAEAKTPRWVLIFGGALLALAILFVGLHLAGGGFGGHHP